MFEKIPTVLTDDPAWVNVSEGSKVPLQTGATRLAASASNPRTWGSFEAAVDNVKRYRYSGIGYVFHNAGIVGIDIDAGYSDDGFVSPIAAAIINRCQSYTERSRSGRGFHILLKGDLPFKGRNNRSGVEIYKDARYFIVTGNVMFHREIIENQDAIDWVLDEFFDDAPPEDLSPSPRVFYSPVYDKPEENKIPLKPIYPIITPGCRNLSLTSLGGQLRGLGYTNAQIFKELLRCNEEACQPPLDRREIEQIVRSVSRYRRTL